MLAWGGSPRGLLSCCGLGLQGAHLAGQGLSGERSGPQRLGLALPQGCRLLPRSQGWGWGAFGNGCLQLEWADLAARG